MCAKPKRSEKPRAPSRNSQTLATKPPHLAVATDANHQERAELSLWHFAPRRWRSLFGYGFPLAQLSYIIRAVFLGRDYRSFDCPFCANGQSVSSCISVSLKS